MPLFEITDAGLDRHSPRKFADLGLYERVDLQRILRDDISVVGDDLLVISEEFGQWEDARRRIDLLAIDKTGHLVVIELKRTDDGGHMELQALRYAAMVSSMSFEDVVNAHAAHVGRHRPDADARSELEAFLETDQDEDGTPVVSSEVRIVLVSADFGRELTTAVLWLNDFDGMDIRCVRLVPYRVGDKVLLDIQQVLPLPEVADYQVRLRRKERQRERARADNRDFTRYHIVVAGQALPDENKRNAVRLMVEQLIQRGVPAAAIGNVLGPRVFRAVEGEITDETQLSERLKEAFPEINLRRFFLSNAIRQDGHTWVLRKNWGRSTEATLNALAQAFPEAQVSFQQADS